MAGGATLAKIVPEGVPVIAGNGYTGFTGDGGPANLATLGSAAGCAADGSGNIYIADGRNNRIRKVSASGMITTVVGTGTAGFGGDGGPATAAQINGPTTVTI